MEVRQLQYFVKAAETLHFTAAAGALYITQSTLSQQIRQLEQELGSLLFDRIGRHVQLTEAGRIFLEHARRVLSEVEKGRQAVADLNQVLTGELRIGVTYAFTSLLLPVLSPFSARYPGIRLLIEYGTTGELERKLHASELDFILAFQKPAERSEFEMQLLYSSRIVMVVSLKNPLAGLPSISLEQLSRQQLVLPGRGFSSRDFLEELFRKEKLSPTVQIEINDVHSLLTMVEMGSWVTVLNEKALVGWKSLAAVPVAGKEWYMDSFILWQKGAYRKRAATLFVEQFLEMQ